MQPNTVRKFRTLAFICIFTCIAGIIYQLINEKSLDHNSLMVGFPLGLVFGFMELFLFPRAKQRLRLWSFTKLIIAKSLIYTAVIYGVAISLTIAGGIVTGKKFSELPPYLLSAELLILVFYTLVVYGLMISFLQINKLLGAGILWKFISGKYHRPREEERIFMFLDMKSSTRIAEQMGHVRFYSLLNDLFHEISLPVLESKGEIYQYVGDEVVLTWEIKDGLQDSNCLKAFFMIREKITNNRDHYLQNFGLIPEFKAGLHSGVVVSAQIGDLKREIVYNGDVLNTTSRIQNECNNYQRDCLISGTLRDRLEDIQKFHWEKLDLVTLRGKEIPIELYSVNTVLSTDVLEASPAEKLSGSIAH